jgi:hypothetical protein
VEIFTGWFLTFPHPLDSTRRSYATFARRRGSVRHTSHLTRFTTSLHLRRAVQGCTLLRPAMYSRSGDPPRWGLPAPHAETSTEGRFLCPLRSPDIQRREQRAAFAVAPCARLKCAPLSNQRRPDPSQSLRQHPKPCAPKPRGRAVRRYGRVPSHITDYLTAAEAGALAPTPAPKPPKKRRRVDIELMHAEVTAAERQAAAWHNHGLRPTDTILR